ncbi:hypothetical protein PGTUg99_019545 [Puccinia graminis f. sp. tritici]|uniref:F-box domain-containing protein n=1 Tax=Puccinia graminis f. sp. tritici TaxID=56615 RepID=A0A5B0Q8W0_PUCGR|nr:hypothetical protein PGTUg99_019545 [Puccinia graminis f. sp. tritici]
MANILDLPREIFERIFMHLITTDWEWGHELNRADCIAYVACHLRQVCRRWADWLYESHLYHTLTFNSASTAIAFANHIRERSKLLPRAKCQYLEIDHFWPWKHLPGHAYNHNEITSEALEVLIDLFSDTIVTLGLKFIEFFTLPSETIEAIGRIKNLRNLTFELSRYPSGMDEFPPTDPDGFNTLLMATRGLKSLRLGLPVSLRPESGLPSITYLHLDFQFEDLGFIISLSIALKPNLKVLSLCNCGRDFDAQTLLPVYENLRETLEGLSVSTSCFLEPILDFNFPKLRVVSVHYWSGSIANWLSQDLFSYAPIQALAISSRSVKGLQQAFPAHPLANLPKLQQLVIMNTRSSFSPTPSYLSVSRSHRVKCTYLDHGEMSLIMKLLMPTDLLQVKKPRHSPLSFIPAT